MTTTTEGPPPAPIRLLILGGTGLLGPQQVAYALARGHHVTVLNRGARPHALPPGVVHLRADRASGELGALRGGAWDAAIDTPAKVPHWVRDAGAALGGRVGHYVFVSTLSAYAARRTPGTDEAEPLHAFAGGDPLAATAADLERDFGRLYGPLKAACEREAARWFDGRLTIVRPGLVVGPGDASGRFAYWPVRVREGGDVLAPGTPDDPVQVIDARDVAEWTVRLAEARVAGTFNAAGPAAPLTIGGLLARTRAAVGSDARFEWVDQDFLAARGVRGWTDLPVWEPRTGDNAGVGRASVARALAAGLALRPLESTVRDTLAWYDSRPPSERPGLRGRFPRERERAVLAEWRARGGRA